jgi:hypothetical protein
LDTLDYEYKQQLHRVDTLRSEMVRANSEIGSTQMEIKSTEEKLRMTPDGDHLQKELLRKRLNEVCIHYLILHPTSNIKHQTSNIKHQTSNIKPGRRRRSVNGSLMNILLQLHV